MHFRKLTAGLGALLMALALPLFVPSAHAAVSYNVGVCNPQFPSRCDQSGPFVPDALSTVSLAVTSSTGRVALTGTGATVLITNNGSVDLYVKLGDVTVTAATTDFFVKAGSQLPFARGTATYVAAITASSTSTLIASTGTGTAAGGSGGGSGGGGGGGAVTVADGADVTQGAIGDTPWSGSGNSTVVAALKSIALNSGGALPAGNAVIGSLVADTHAQCAALCANLVVKASAGTLKSFEVSADSTLSGAIWYVIVYDSTTAPADGAITPAKCYQQQSGVTQMGGTLGPGGTAYATGITIGVSTSGCFTKTASTHAFIAGDFQ